MHTWVRAAAVTVIGAIMGGVACSGTGTATIPRQGMCARHLLRRRARTPHPDGPTSCATGPCNYQTQAGCPAGQTCWPHIDAVKGPVTPTCRAGGSQKKGESVTTNKAVQPGLLLRGRRLPNDVLRRATGRHAPPGESCFHQAMAAIGESLVYAGLRPVLPGGHCDVLDRRRACLASEAQVCRRRRPDGRGRLHAAERDLALGAACDRLDQCDAGMICAGLSGSGPTNGTCRRLCRWAACGAPACGASDGECVHFTRDPDGVGECTPDWQGKPVVSDGGVLYEPGRRRHLRRRTLARLR